MDERIRELEMELLSVKFLNELLLAKLEVSTEDIQNYAKYCLEEMPQSEKNTDMYYYLMGTAYHENAAEEIRKDKQ
ncbi:hypothetical protein [Enterococcus wangshanyuanii]|uniref:Uncharacterized protein n=1 Tax=Enterococcus wangshanyuanii TaxID=2005703 RepID=A0ABQ1P4R3_9ENTE|nr:hypothetical protein [Enterococcus wangshanyuanii]GGC90714.1 hypothetical protein GCM10011573_20430 [Enterococcus wangshanyuanii]